MEDDGGWIEGKMDGDHPDIEPLAKLSRAPQFCHYFWLWHNLTSNRPTPWCLDELHFAVRNVYRAVREVKDIDISTVKWFWKPLYHAPVPPSVACIVRKKMIS